MVNEDNLESLSSLLSKWHTCRVLWIIHERDLSTLVKTGKKINSLPDVQLPMQNCTTVQYFVLHAAHGWKAYHISFPTQQTSYHLGFPIRSYGRFSGDCTEDQQPREVPRVFSSW